VNAVISDAELAMVRLTDAISQLEVETKRLTRESDGIRSVLWELERELRWSAQFLLKENDPREYLFRNAPNLALAIENRMNSAQAVLVIAYPDSAYRTWLVLTLSGSSAICESDRSVKILPDIPLA
jgi:hypothetical protein